MAVYIRVNLYTFVGVPAPTMLKWAPTMSLWAPTRISKAPTTVLTAWAPLIVWITAHYRIIFSAMMGCKNRRILNSIKTEHDRMTEVHEVSQTGCDQGCRGVRCDSGSNPGIYLRVGKGQNRCGYLVP